MNKIEQLQLQFHKTNNEMENLEKLVEEYIAEKNKKERKQAVFRDAKDLRNRCNRIVRMVAVNEKQSFRAVWGEIYLRFKQKTHIDVVAFSHDLGKEAHLDVVEEMGLLRPFLSTCVEYQLQH